MLLCLSKNYQLLVNNLILHQNVSSFSLAGGFLLIITRDKFLHTIPIEKIFNFSENLSSEFFNSGNIFKDIFYIKF